MFSKLNQIVRSSSFKQQFFMLLFVNIIFAGGLVLHTKHTTKRLIQQERNIIEEELAWFTEIYNEDGLRALIGELTEEDDALWDEERYKESAAEFALVWQITNSQGKVLAGVPQLNAKEGWQTLWVKDFGLSQPLDVFTVLARRGYKLSLGKFRHPSVQLARQSSRTFVIVWLLLAIPLSLCLSLILTHRRLKRISVLVNESDAIAAGNTQGRLTISQRADELDTLANSVNTMVEHLQSLQRNIDSVSVGIAHDLKTPVTQLDGRMQLIEQDIDNAALVEEHLSAAREHIRKILDTFQALLRLGEIEAGQRQKLFATFNLSDVLLDIAESYQPVFTDAGKSLDVSILDDIYIRGDADLVIQMVINLLENSIQHSQQQAKAWLRLQMSKDAVVLQIGDNGPGIPAEDADRIFERFYRVDKSRTKNSNGLGLSLVKSICDLHNADICLLPNQKGAVFDIYISVNN